MLRSAIAVFVVALANFACLTPPPTLVPLGPDDPRPARLLAALTETSNARRGLRGRARLSVDAAEGELRLRSKQVIALERPGRLRVEVKALFDQTLAVLVTDAGEYELLRADDQSYRRGIVEPGLLWETALIDLAPDVAVQLFLAAPRLDAGATLLGARSDAAGGVELDLAGAEAQLRHRLRFDPVGTLSSIERFAPDGRREWRAEYSEYAVVGDDTFPHYMKILTAADSEAEVSLSGIELNPELPAELFRLRPR